MNLCRYWNSSTTGSAVSSGRHHANIDTDPQRYVRLRDQGLPILLVNGYMSGYRHAVPVQ